MSDSNIIVTLPEHVQQRFDEHELQLIQQAYTLCYVHQQNKPPVTELCPYADHLEGMRLVDSLGMDKDSLLATLLYGVLAEGGIDQESIENLFGNHVMTLISGVQRMTSITELGRDDAEYADTRLDGLRKLLIAMAEDLRVVIIHLAIRVVQMRVLKHCSDEVKVRFSKDTNDIFSPLANRLGIWQFKWELEDLSFRFLYPQEYKEIARALDEKRSERERFIENAVTELKTLLKSENIRAEVKGRPKHIYSIWRKMSNKNVAFNELYDVRAVRVLVDNVRDCYSVLGIVHSLWTHIPSEFDDYIAKPKANNYQSLHTAVVDHQDQALEIQIRTHDMHHHAEYGVAAHWRYKEGGGGDSSLDDKVAWLRQVLDTNAQDAEYDFLDSFKSEVFHDRVYVLSPRGKVIDLPRGATPLDFAYAIHSEVGHRCRGAKVNGKMVTLDTELNNGEKVEIITAKDGQPSRDWLNTSLGYLITSKARNHVRSWFRAQDYDVNLKDGRDLLERELKRLGVSDVNLDQLAQRLKFKHPDDLFAALGRGDITSAQIAGGLSDQLLPAKPANVIRRKKPKASSRFQSDVLVEGVGNLLTQIAACCKPAPPDEIVGYITQGKGVTVHRSDCQNILGQTESEKERLIKVNWANSEDSVYPVDIVVQAYDRQGLLRDITQIISNSHINLTGINTHTDEDTGTAHMQLSVEVCDVEMLSRLLSRLTQLANVYEVKRA